MDTTQSEIQEGDVDLELEPPAPGSSGSSSSSLDVLQLLPQDTVQRNVLQLQLPGSRLLLRHLGPDWQAWVRASAAQRLNVELGQPFLQSLTSAGQTLHQRFPLLHTLRLFHRVQVRRLHSERQAL